MKTQIKEKDKDDDARQRRSKERKRKNETQAFLKQISKQLNKMSTCEKSQTV